MLGLQALPTQAVSLGNVAQREDPNFYEYLYMSDGTVPWKRPCVHTSLCTYAASIDGRCHFLVGVICVFMCIAQLLCRLLAAGLVHQHTLVHLVKGVRAEIELLTSMMILTYIGWFRIKHPAAKH